MKKKLSVLLLAALLALICTACGSKKDTKEIDVDITKLCEDLEGTITSGGLQEVPTDILASTFFFDMDKIEESIAALNSGASACEVVVIKCKDSSYVTEAQQLLKNRMENQSKLFADYNAPEAAKIDNAVLKTAGSYVAFCVTDDTAKAEDILKNAGF